MKNLETVDTVPAPVPADAATLPAPRARSSADLALQTVDPACYEVTGEIARGGMGRISIAHDRRHGRAVAIKEVLGDGDTRRFEHEALITARLQHPAIVPVYEAGRWPDGAPFYAMKMVSGHPLDKVIAAAPTLVARMALLPNVIAACDALAYAHNLKIIHRDLKPSNVLVGSFGETVVIDWGLAKPLGHTDLPSIPSQGGTDMTLAGDVLGTPQYMPPEQASGEPVDERADVYALGAMLYHLLAGVPPYDVTTSVHALVARVIDGPPPSLDSRVSGIPPDLLAIVDKAMARDRRRRYRDARDLVEDLRRFQTGQLVRAHSYTLSERFRRFVRKHRGATAIAMIAMLALAIGGGLSLRRIFAEIDRADGEAARARAASVVADAERDDANVLARQTLDELASTLDRIGRLELLEPIAKHDVEYYERIDQGRRMTPARTVDYAAALALLARAQVKRGQFADANARLEHAQHLLESLEGAGSADAMLALANILARRASVDSKVGHTSDVLDHAHAALQLAERVGTSVEARQAAALALTFIGFRERVDERYDDARAHYRRAIELLATDAERDALVLRAQALFELGLVDVEANVPVAARAELDQAFALARKVVDDARAQGKRDLGALALTGHTQRSIGKLLLAQGKLDEAAVAAREVELTYNSLLAAEFDDRSFASFVVAGYELRSQISQARGDRKEAARALVAATQLVDGLLARDPDNFVWLRQLAQVHQERAALAYDHDELETALAALAAAERAARRALAATREASDLHQLIATLDTEGEILVDQHHLAEAIARFDEEHRLALELVAQPPDHRAWLRDLANAEEQLGNAMVSAGDHKGIEVLVENVAHRRQIATDRPFDAGTAKAVVEAERMLDKARKRLETTGH